MEVQEIKVSELKPSAYNPREITEKDFSSLKKSIQEFGFVEPVVINKEKGIIGGHMRVKAAQELSMETIPCVTVDLPPEREKLLNLALNRISGRWNTQKLGELIVDLSTKKVDLDLSGFEGWEIEYYNLGPDELDKEALKIEGAEPSKSSVVIFVFDNEKEANKCSAYFNDGKPVKTLAGKKLLELISA